MPHDLGIIDVKTSYITNVEKEKKMFSNDSSNDEESECESNSNEGML